MATETELEEQIVASDPFTGHVEEEPEPLETEESGTEEGGEESKGKSTKAEPITPDTLAEAIKKAFPQGDPKKEPPPEPKKLSPEEYEKQYKVWKFGDDFHQRLTSSDPVIANKALTEMRDGMTQQSVTMAYHIAQELIKPVLERLEGVAGTTQSLAAEKQRERFMTTYPELEPHNDILKMVSDQLVASGFQPKDEKEAHEKIAQTTEKLLQAVNPQFKLGGKTQQQPNKSTTRPKMTTTSRGGQGGAGESGSSGKDNRPKGMDIFDA